MSNIGNIVKKTVITAGALTAFGWWWYVGYQERHQKDNLDSKAIVINEIKYIDTDSNGTRETVAYYTDSTGETKEAVLKRTDTGIVGYDTSK